MSRRRVQEVFDKVVRLRHCRDRHTLLDRRSGKCNDRVCGVTQTAYRYYNIWEYDESGNLVNFEEYWQILWSLCF